MFVLAFAIEFLLECLSADTTQRQDALSAEWFVLGLGTPHTLPVVGEVTCGRSPMGELLGRCPCIFEGGCKPILGAHCCHNDFNK